MKDAIIDFSLPALLFIGAMASGTFLLRSCQEIDAGQRREVQQTMRLCIQQGGTYINGACVLQEGPRQ